MTAPLWIHEDRSRGLALIRGNARPVLELAHLTDVARWSVTARGWVLPLDRVADFAVTADLNWVSYRVKQVRE